MIGIDFVSKYKVDGPRTILGDLMTACPTVVDEVGTDARLRTAPGGRLTCIIGSSSGTRRAERATRPLE